MLNVSTLICIHYSKLRVFPFPKTFFIKALKCAFSHKVTDKVTTDKVTDKVTWINPWIIQQSMDWIIFNNPWIIENRWIIIQSMDYLKNQSTAPLSSNVAVCCIGTMPYMY